MRKLLIVVGPLADESIDESFLAMQAGEDRAEPARDNPPFWAEGLRTRGECTRGNDVAADAEASRGSRPLDRRAAALIPVNAGGAEDLLD